MPCLIFLTGMPGAGKTYWGAKIATACGWQFADLDTCIAQEEMASIPALFASYGESGFREREQKCLKNVISSSIEPTIVACGGGTPCYSDNMQLMLQTGTVVYLRAEVADLIANLNATDEVRPLLKNRENLAAYLAELLVLRTPVYKKAHYILQTEDISLTTFAEIISSCTNRQ